MTTQTYIVETFAGDNGEFFWRIRNTNSKTGATSEGYKRKNTRDRIAKRLSRLTGFALVAVDG